MKRRKSLSKYFKQSIFFIPFYFRIEFKKKKKKKKSEEEKE